MKEYIEREAALSAVDCGNLHKGIVDALQENIKEIPAPTVDAVPVVRCKDCRHRDPEDHKCDCGAMERQGCPFPVDDDYFCKYGERKGGEE